MSSPGDNYDSGDVQPGPVAAPRSFAIVPAAGRSRRMGRAKLLLPWRGATVVETVLSSWRASEVDRVVVTVGPDDVELAARCRGCGADVVVVAGAPPQMKDSVRLGLDHAAAFAGPRDADVWLVAPADSIGLSTRVINLVLEAYRRHTDRIVVPRLDGRRGHPVAFPWRLAAEVAVLAADEGVNALLGRYAVHELDVSHVVDVEPELWAADIDTPEEYRWLWERFGRP